MRVRFEIIAVAITGILKLLMVDVLHLKFWFILSATLFWILYIAWSLRKERGVLSRWGFSSVGFWATVKWLIVPAFLVVSGSAWYGWSHGHMILSWHIIPVLILYPLWGTLQQFLLISLFGGNLIAMHKPKLSNAIVIVLASILFSIIHYPSFPLMAATLLLALGYMWLFLRYHNIMALGIFHGWLAAFFYFFALGRDAWMEFLSF